MKGLSDQELKAVKTLTGAETARMVYRAMAAGATAMRLAEQMGVTRQRVHQLRDKGFVIIEEEHAATTALKGLYGGGK